MTLIRQALNFLLNNENYCCVCFELLEDNAVLLSDKVLLTLNKNAEEIYFDVITIIKCIIGTEVNISKSSGICKACATIVVKSYKFIKQLKENHKILEMVTENLGNSLENNSIVDLSQNIFISFEHDLSCSVYNEGKRNECISNVKEKERCPLILNLNDKTQIKVEDCDGNLEPGEVIIDVQEIIPRKKMIKVKEILNKTRFAIKSTDDKKKYVHIPIHTKDMLVEGTDTDQHKCKECLRDFKRIDNLRQHYIRLHAPKSFKCNICSRSYGSSSLLAAHKAESHISIVCSKCGKTFNNRSTLKQHEMNHKRVLVCHNCGRVYKNKHTYKHHIKSGICLQKTRKSQNEARYTCEICNKKYSQMSSLRVHMRFEHGNAEYHICSWCGKKFVAPSRLKAHIVTHTKERKFPCTICGGKFVSKESLTYHMRIHTGETPYPCEFCNKSFLSFSRRTEHVKRKHMQHMKSDKECDICHSKFNITSALHRHRKRHFNPKSRLHKKTVSEDE